MSAMKFFVATPELGLDAVLLSVPLSVPLLGSSLTVARVVAAFAVAVLVALLVGGRSRVPGATERHATVATRDAPWPDRNRAGFRFGFVEVFDHTMPWVALGLIVAGERPGPAAREARTPRREATARPWSRWPRWSAFPRTSALRTPAKPMRERRQQHTRSGQDDAGEAQLAHDVGKHDEKADPRDHHQREAVEQRPHRGRPRAVRAARQME